MLCNLLILNLPVNYEKLRSCHQVGRACLIRLRNKAIGFLVRSWQHGALVYLSPFPELDEYIVEVVDGHFIEHACHTEKNDK